MGITKLNHFKGIRKRQKGVPSSLEKEVVETAIAETVRRSIGGVITMESVSSKQLELLDLSIDKMMDVKNCLKTESKVYNSFLIIEKQSLNKLLSCLC